MSTARQAPAREPAWSLSRSAIGLWVAQGVVVTVVEALVVAALIVFVPSDAGLWTVLVRWVAPAGVRVVGAGPVQGTASSVRRTGSSDLPQTT